MQQTKIAIIGSGGREHALSWKLAQSLGQANVYTLPGNGGIPNSHAVAIDQFSQIESFCKQHHITTIIVGPEQSLVEGIVNYFSKTPIRVFGPDETAAQLEGSKIFAKNFMQQYGVQTAGYHICSSASQAEKYIQKYSGNLVIKYDGLAGGKGVYVCSDIAEAQADLANLIDKFGSEADFIIEEKLVGQEISIIGITDGKSIVLFPATQDHKQLLDGDKGPNTGGMGAFTPVSFCDENLMAKIQQKIIAPTLKGIQAEKFNYKGFIFFGLMIQDNQPYLLEYNVRMGDPETEVILPAIKNDLWQLIAACFKQQLSQQQIEVKNAYFVDVVKVSDGYPKNYATGKVIQGLDKLSPTDLVFHAGTKQQGNQILTAGGRVLNCVGQGQTLQQAINSAYALCQKVSFEGEFYRKDIGSRHQTDQKQI